MVISQHEDSAVLVNIEETVLHTESEDFKKSVGSDIRGLKRCLVDAEIKEISSTSGSTGHSEELVSYLNSDNSDVDEDYIPSDTSSDTSDNERPCKYQAMPSKKCETTATSSNNTDDIVSNDTFTNKSDDGKDQINNSNVQPKKPKYNRVEMKEKKMLEEEHITRKGIQKPAKVFQALTSCCRNKCHKKLSIDDQKEIFYDFLKKVQDKDQVISVRIEPKKTERKDKGERGNNKNRQIVDTYDDLLIIDPFESVPKFYSSFAEDELEGLVMENLKTQQYELWDKKVPMNPGHIKAVLIEYAKFHAVSFAMKQKNPALFKKLSEKNGTNPFEKKNASEKDNEERYKKFFSDTLSNGYKVLKDDPELTEKLKKYEQIVDTEFMSKLKEPEYKLVITHGDCWCNNFLFKYQDPNDKTKPEDLRIVDWQISSFGSPCADLAYFLLVNSSEEVFNDIQTYLKIYHDKLSSQLRNFNLDPDELFPFSRLSDHLNQFLLQSFFFVFLLLKIMVSDKEDIPDHVEEVDKSGDSMTMLSYETKNVEEYTRRVKIIMQFLIKNKYF
uniref:Uncharacterized protein LOC114338728 n=1 Tax=Diabrotica virgifera virgifera TaxID=50390 RepID=A0A6P7G7V4_DIAVI